MGLAGPRKRTKISHDPNNTNWSRSTTGFGHKILTAQGWTPGNFLGARNASHADTFTAASASHIRVALKDDNLGLGARPRGPLSDEPTGLDAFQGLLGRLNGKTDVELEKEQRKRDNVKLALYAERRWTAVRFVRGGLLVQEKPEKPPKEDQTTGPENAKPDTNDDVAASQAKKERKEKQQKKHRKSKSKSKEIQTEDSDEDPTEPSASGSGPDIGRSATKKRKSKSKKRRNDEDESSRPLKSTVDLGESTKMDTSEEVSSETNAKNSDNNSGTSAAATRQRERKPLGRHVIRGRYIHQKKMALMDTKALNEIFMVKS